MQGYDIFFNEESHEYLVDGKPCPSVTEILKPLHRSYGAVNPSVLQAAANRGTAVHEALQLIDYDAEPEVYPETEGYIRAYLEWQKIYRPSWYGIEQIVFDDTSFYIGTLDRVGYLNGNEFAVVDIKTSQPTKEALVSVCVQTHAYANAYFFSHDDCPYDIKRYGLFLKGDGNFRFLDCDEYEDKYGFSAENVWNELFICHRLINQVLKTGGEK